jgi:hypothetical protein
MKAVDRPHLGIGYRGRGVQVDEGEAVALGGRPDDSVDARNPPRHDPAERDESRDVRDPSV